MAPKRSNKGKEKMESDDQQLFKVPGMSYCLRVKFSKTIEALVHSRDGEKFETLFNISKRTFNFLRTLVKDGMVDGSRRFKFWDGKGMTLNDQIAVALTRLSSANTSVHIAMTFETNYMTVDAVTWEFVQALEEHGAEHISWPKDIAALKMRFESIGGMPNCYGALEATHIKMYPNKSEGETDIWVDSKNNKSMQLQVIVDPAMRFVDVFAGFPGRMTKDHVLQESQIFSLAQTEKKLNGNEIKLSKRKKIREYLVGDSGYQLLPWLITPYHGDKLTKDQTEFNKKHLATRSVASRALKRLKEVWAAIESEKWQPSRHKLPRIILACCILHNIQIEMEGEMVSNETMTLADLDHNPGYPPEKSGLPDDKKASVVRDELCLYLVGKLPVYIG